MVDDLEESPVPASCVYLSDEGVQGGWGWWNRGVDRGEIYERNLIKSEVAVFGVWAVLWREDENRIEIKTRFGFALNTHFGCFDILPMWMKISVRTWF